MWQRRQQTLCGFQSNNGQPVRTTSWPELNGKIPVGSQPRIKFVQMLTFCLPANLACEFPEFTFT